MRLDNHSYSPSVLQKIAEATARLPSAADAAFALGLADIKISSRHVQRISGEIGSELIEKRDHKVAQQLCQELPVRVVDTPEVVAVEVDGGRLRTRAADCGPGVHQAQNKEDKLACLVSLKSEVSKHDPQPEPPPSFREPRRVQRLVQQMKGLSGDPPPEEAAEEKEPPPKQAKAKKTQGPQRQVRTCVASMAECHTFGPMVAAEAQERGFYQAKRRAYVGDGAAYNWSIHEEHFSDFEPITDFLHVLCYVYGAAWGVGNTDEQRWSIYEKWMRACWQGHVVEVIKELNVCQVQMGVPPVGEKLDKKDPRRLVADALSYLGNNQNRMDYARYRRRGLPITSSLVESLVGEFNARVKSRQKFWNRAEGAEIGGAEIILQLRAAFLSEDDRLARFFAERPGNPYHNRKVA